jgi:phage shock protein PspC (stress-responsive transcriptional regulator)
MTNDRSINTAQTPRLYRSSQDRVLGGVCAGIAEYFGRDIVLVRLAAVVLAVISGGVGVFAYLVAWALIPSASGHRAAGRNVPPGSAEASGPRDARTAVGDELRAGR